MQVNRSCLFKRKSTFNCQHLCSSWATWEPLWFWFLFHSHFPVLVFYLTIGASLFSEPLCFSVLYSTEQQRSIGFSLNGYFMLQMKAFPNMILLEQLVVKQPQQVLTSRWKFVTDWLKLVHITHTHRHFSFVPVSFTWRQINSTYSNMHTILLPYLCGQYWQGLSHVFWSSQQHIIELIYPLSCTWLLAYELPLYHFVTQ